MKSPDRIRESQRMNALIKDAEEEGLFNGLTPREKRQLIIKVKHSTYDSAMKYFQQILNIKDAKERKEREDAEKLMVEDGSTILNAVEDKISNSIKHTPSEDSTLEHKVYKDEQ